MIFQSKACKVYKSGEPGQRVRLTWGAGNVNPAWQHRGWDQRHRGFPGGGRGLRGHPFPGGGSPLRPDVPWWPRETPSQPVKRYRERVLIIVHEDLRPSRLSLLMESVRWEERRGKNGPLYGASASLTVPSYLRRFNSLPYKTIALRESDLKIVPRSTLIVNTSLHICDWWW